MCSGEGAVVQSTRDFLPSVVVGLCEGMLINFLDDSSGKVSLSDDSITFLPALVLRMDGHIRTLDLHQNVIHLNCRLVSD